MRMRNKNGFKRKKELLSVFLAAFLLLTACGSNMGIAATVNGKDITMEEYQSEYDIYRGITSQRLGEDALKTTHEDGTTLEEKMRMGILDKLILERLIQEDSEKNNISVSDSEIETKVLEYVEQLGGKENADKFFAENKITEEYFKEDVKRQLLVEKHRAHVMDSMKVSDAEEQKYFAEHQQNLEKVDVSCILLKTEEEAKNVLNRIRGGVKFEDIAMLESIDKISAVNGGNIGFIKRGDYPELFETTAFSLKEGGIGEPIKTEIGYYIIKVNRKMDTLPLLRDDVTEAIKYERYMTYIAELQEHAKIKRYLKQESENK